MGAPWIKDNFSLLQQSAEMASTADRNKPTCKVVIVGDGATGKTSLVQTFVEGKFSTEYIPTCYDNVFVDYALPASTGEFSSAGKGGKSAKQKTVKLFLWDTAGGEDYDRLRALSFPQTDCFIVAFSVVSPTAFANVGSKWVPYVRHYMPDTPIVLCGTKRDLREDQESFAMLESRLQKPVSFEQAVAEARRLDCHSYVECSAKTNLNVEAVFQECVAAAFQGSVQPGGEKNRCLMS